MKLKKGDVILSIEKQPVESKKQSYRLLSFLLKKKKEFSIVIHREKRNLLISYRILPYKGKKKIIISDKKKIQLEKKVVSQNIKPTEKLQNKKKTLIPEEYKPYMQRAYVSSLNSFVYKKANFDSIKLHPLSIGKKILISRKIFRPSHNFGTFYKVFLFKEKKVIGYISEAEVIPEFKRKEGVFIPNPSYKVAKKYKSENRVLDLESIKEIKKESKTSKSERKSSPAVNKRRYIGLSFGLLTRQINFSFPKEDLFIGIKISGYNLLVSYLNMDINLTSTFDWRHFYLDILTAYPVLKSPYYYLLVMGGLMGNLRLDKDYATNPNSIDYGPAGALSLLVPLNKNIMFRLDGKTVYEVNSHSMPFGFLASLQLAF